MNFRIGTTGLEGGGGIEFKCEDGRMEGSRDRVGSIPLHSMLEAMTEVNEVHRTRHRQYSTRYTACEGN